MPARPRPAALEAEGPAESRTALLSRQALNTRRTEIRTVAHWRVESRRVERSERQRDRTAKVVQFPRRETPLWNFFRHGVRRAQLLHTVLVCPRDAGHSQDIRTRVRRNGTRTCLLDSPVRDSGRRGLGVYLVNGLLRNSLHGVSTYIQRMVHVSLRC